MKKLNYKSGMLLTISLFLISFALSAQEATKEFHEEYTAGANTTLEISNRYGDVIIQSWDNDQVVIDVQVTVEARNIEKSQQLLDYIDVEFEEDGNTISATTIIDDKFNFSGWGNNSKKFSIDYNIKMPAETALKLSNKYGNTDIDELNGLVDLNIKYGNLRAGKLTRGNVKPINQLYLAYGKGSIDETGWLDMYIRYCGKMEITKSKALLLDSKYSKLYLGETSSVVGKSKYDNLDIESIKNLILENGYTDLDIGELTKQLTYEGSYGSLTVDNIPAGFESLDVDTRYLSVKIGIETSANYTLDAKVKYGGLSFNDDDFVNQKRIIETTSKEISGTVGNEESPSSSVKVSATYGSVRLY
jgi:hypothetical protein